MKKAWLVLVIILSLFFVSTPSSATPLRMEYSVTQLGTMSFQYNFSLILDNNDGTWFSGQGFNWIIFGDNLSAYDSSPLRSFVGNPADLPIGPFNHYSSCSGDHSGPTLLNYNSSTGEGIPWIPSFLGESLHWSGTSTRNLQQGSLLFSNMWGNVESEGITSDTTNPAHREVAYRVAPVPIPPSVWLLGSGLIGLIGLRRKFFRK